MTSKSMLSAKHISLDMCNVPLLAGELRDRLIVTEGIP